MSLSFPASAFVGQVYNGFTWDGVKWTATPFSTQPAKIALEVQLQGNQTVTAAAFNTVKYDTVITDLQSAYNPATGLFTPKQAGLYSVVATYATNMVASSQQAIAIVKNGALTNAESIINRWYPPLAGTANTMSVSALINCNGTTDTISCMGLAPTGVTTFYANATAANPVTMIATLLMVGPAGPPGGVSSGNLTLLSRQTITAPVVSVAFAGLITSQYDDYEVHAEGLIPSANGTFIAAQVSTDGGATWVAGTSYITAMYYVVSQGSPLFGNVSTGGTGIAQWQLGTGTDTVASYNTSSRIILFRPQSTLMKFIMADTVAINSTNGIGRSVVAGSCNIGAYNSFRINASSGNWTAGTVELYGKVR